MSWSLGGGNAALCAAITAARAGCSVVVLEGAPEFYRGGNTRHTRNLRCAHDGTAPTMTGPYEQAEFLDDLYRVTGGQTDKALARADHRALERIAAVDGRAGRAFPAAARRHAQSRQAPTRSFSAAGAAMLNALYRTAEALGVDLLYDAPVIGTR